MVCTEGAPCTIDACAAGMSAAGTTWLVNTVVSAAIPAQRPGFCQNRGQKGRQQRRSWAAGLGFPGENGAQRARLLAFTGDGGVLFVMGAGHCPAAGAGRVAPRPDPGRGGATKCPGIFGVSFISEGCVQLFARSLFLRLRVLLSAYFCS